MYITLFLHLYQDKDQQTDTISKRRLPEKGEFVAVRCSKYSEKPLIGHVTSLNGNNNLTIDWFIGTYSGYWKEWKGRHEGKLIVLDEIAVEDIVLSSISFTKSWKLPPKTVTVLKELY